MERDVRLREELVGRLERSGILTSERLAATMRRVPRHLFVPGHSLEEGYADRAIALKVGGGDVVSSISQPSMVAEMLQLLEPLAGETILEIGGGSGYNAALIAELVGPAGRVMTVELDPEIAGAARQTLESLGYANVDVVVADGSAALGLPAPDRIIVSARCEDVASAWWDELPEGGRIVVPLRLEGAGEFAVGFDRHGNRLTGIGAHPCAFVPMRGLVAREGTGGVFYRDPSRKSAASVRGLTSIEAVRAFDATPELLRDADVVVARPVSVFSLRLSGRAP